MVDKKELNQEQLEEVSGGVPYFGATEPTAANFCYHVGDTVSYGQFINENWTEAKEYTVVALGKRYTGGNDYVKGYDLYYKLEAKNRTYASLDGWYDIELDISPRSGYVIGRRIVKVDEAGITIVA